MKTSTLNKECRVCKGREFKKFLDLGKTPLVNRFLKEEELEKEEPRFPLRVYFCPNCHLVQLRDVVDKKDLFRDYIYFSSGMPKLSDHFQKYAEDVSKRFLKDRKDLVVELGSNDGILLKFFKDSGYKVLGVDPALNIKKSVPTVEDFFSEKLARKIRKEKGLAKVVMGNNVIAHINDHHDLVRGLDALLVDDGVFVFEAPYLLDMFDNLAYDTIYHEHLSCLSLAPLVKLFGLYGLYVFDVKLFSVQGQSLRVWVSRPGRYPISKRVGELLALEKEMGFGKARTYNSLSKRIGKSRDKLSGLLKKLKGQGKSIAVYGASARGNTILNYTKVNSDLIDYAVDDLPSKQGLYTPGSHIPVISSLESRKKYPDYFLLLAWNYANVILKKEKEFLKQGGKFIMPINNIEIL